MRSRRTCRTGIKFDFLAKPFTLKQLVATVKETMSRSEDQNGRKSA